MSCHANSRFCHCVLRPTLITTLLGIRASRFPEDYVAALEKYCLRAVARQEANGAPARRAGVTDLDDPEDDAVAPINDSQIVSLSLVSGMLM